MGPEQKIAVALHHRREQKLNNSEQNPDPGHLGSQNPEQSQAQMADGNHYKAILDFNEQNEELL